MADFGGALCICSCCRLAIPEGLPCPQDGSLYREAWPIPVHEDVRARFEVDRPFAHGATGTLYRAKQISTGYVGVLKMLDLGIEPSHPEHRRLKGELRAQTALDNPWLPKVFDGGEQGSRLWLFREHARGMSLASLLRRRGKVDVDSALAITLQVANGLDYLHKGGLVHLDVKPGHIIVDMSEAVPRARLIDAGIAELLETSTLFELRGNRKYMAPEVAGGSRPNMRGDIYALGCVMYEMLTGAPPFVRDTKEGLIRAHREEEPASLDVGLPFEVTELLFSMLAKRAADRPLNTDRIMITLQRHAPQDTPRTTRISAKELPVLRLRRDSDPDAKPSIIPVSREQVKALTMPPKDKTIDLNADEVAMLLAGGQNRTIDLRALDIESLVLERNERTESMRPAAVAGPAVPTDGERPSMGHGELPERDPNREPKESSDFKLPPNRRHRARTATIAVDGEGLDQLLSAGPGKTIDLNVADIKRLVLRRGAVSMEFDRETGEAVVDDDGQTSGTG